MNASFYQASDAAYSRFHVSFRFVGLRRSRLKGQYPEFTVGSLKSGEVCHWKKVGEGMRDEEVEQRPLPKENLFPT